MNESVIFEIPTFSFWMVLYTAIGAAVFWAKMGRLKLKAFVLSDLLDLLPIRGKHRRALELLVFVAIGTVVGIGVAKPRNVPQAISAGIAWTGLFTVRRAVADEGMIK